MKQIIAMHGWGGDSNNWQSWIPLFLKNEWIWQSCDRGYGEIKPFRAQWLRERTHQASEKRIIISHSLGIHLLEKEVLQRATHVVLLSSFSRFLPENRKNSRALRTALKGMATAIGLPKEKEMMRNFLVKSAKPYPSKLIPLGPLQKGLSLTGRKQLLGDLELLANTDCIPIGFPKNSKVLVIHGKEDSILSQHVKNNLINDLKDHLGYEPNHWIIENEGHFLLLPELITRIKNWMDLN